MARIRQEEPGANIIYSSMVIQARINNTQVFLWKNQVSQVRELAGVKGSLRNLSKKQPLLLCDKPDGIV